MIKGTREVARSKVKRKGAERKMDHLPGSELPDVWEMRQRMAGIFLWWEKELA